MFPSCRIGRLLTLAGMVLGALALAGCAGPYLADDIDLDFDFSLSTRDALHLPYVQGTKVTLFADSTDKGQKKETPSWWLESSDSTVLRIDDQKEATANCTAVRAGSAEVRIYRRKGDPSPIHASTITVRLPTRAALYAHGPLLIHRSEDEALSQRPKILVGGTATFLVKYFDGDQLLFGNGVLKASSPGLIDLVPKTTFFLENREWLAVTPHASGVHRVSLGVDRMSLGLEIVGASPSDVDHLELLGEDEGDARDGQWLAILGAAYDAQGQPILGVDFDWDLDGTRQEGEGDMYRYEHRSGQIRQLGAQFAGQRAEVMISAGEGYVWSSNQLGCSTSPASPRAGGSAFPILAAGAVLVLRRRRPLSRPT